VSEKIEALRTVVEDEGLDIAQRRDAAAHIVTLTVDAVPEVPDADTEVVTLTTPWADPVLAKIAADATGGRSVNGYSLPDAKQTVIKRHRVRALLAVVVDDTAHKLIRLAACQTALDGFLHPNGVHRRSAYTAERLLAEVRPSDSFKWTSKGKEQIARPPLSLADVWDM
jgi:hypothetical protein